MRTRLTCVIVIGLGLVGLAARADEKPATPAKGYELRVVAVGDTFQARQRRVVADAQRGVGEAGGGRGPAGRRL